jgi:hypothetical protein
MAFCYAVCSLACDQNFLSWVHGQLSIIPTVDWHIIHQYPSAAEVLSWM